MHHIIFIEYHILYCWNFVPLNLDFNTSGNICSMIFWFVDAGVYYTLITQKLPKALWCYICFKLAIVLVVNCSSSWQCDTHTLWVTQGNVLPYMVLTPVFLPPPPITMDVIITPKYKIKIWGNLHRTNCIHIWLLKHTNFSSLRVTWFLTCRMSDPDPLIFSDFNYDESPTWNFGWLDHPIIGCYTSFSQVEKFFHVSNMRLLKKKLTKNSNTKEISITYLGTISLTWRICFS